MLCECIYGQCSEHPGNKCKKEAEVAVKFNESAITSTMGAARNFYLCIDCSLEFEYYTVVRFL